MNTTEQLKFIVDFANRDLANTREGDWINLQDDFARFFPDEGTAAPGEMLFESFTGERYPKQKLVPLQSELRSLLQVRTKTPMTHATIPPVHVELNYVLISGGILNVWGDHRDLFLQRVINLLSDSKMFSSIKECPKCGKFFFKVRRQKYCSRTCVLATNKKDWLDKQRRLEAKEKEQVSKGKKRVRRNEQAARATKPKKRGRK